MASVGSRLKELRIEHGYSQRQLAEYLEIDQSNLSKIENDKRKLNWLLSDKILSLYNCTPEYLLGKTDLFEKQNISFKSARDIDLNVIAHINRLSSDLKILRKFDDAKIDNKLPKLNINLKRKWGVDEFSPINMFNLLTYKIPNLTIAWFPMKSSVSGCCYKNEEDFIILVNSSHSRGHQNFTLAHELYHLLDDENFIICSDKYEDIIEKNADEFASNFLMSERALYDYIESNNIDAWTISDVIKCEQYFQLDHRNFIKRLYAEKLISGNQFAELSINFIKMAASLGYDTSLYKANYKDMLYFSIGHMIPITEKLYEQKKLTQGARRDILLDLFRQDIVY